MLASYKLLKRFVDLDGITPEQIEHKLTFAGLEVEGVERLAYASNLVIGQILKVENHPDSDHLHILQVDEGEKYGVEQIVCGAPNVRVGLKVIVARPGAVLSKDKFTISKYEQGTREPDLATLEKIKVALDCSYDDLLK